MINVRLNLTAARTLVFWRITPVTARPASPLETVHRKFRADGWADRREQSPKPFENHGIGSGVPLVL
jgi:hypothetical protein